MMTNNDSKCLVYEKFIKLTDEDFTVLKNRYDVAFEKYWTYGNNPPKFSRISMNEFKERLKNSSIDFFKKYGEIKNN